jgi:hypothetical protein
MQLPIGPLEHAVQVAHESTGRHQRASDEVFEEGVTRQQLRMLWHLRTNLEAIRLEGRQR